MERRSRLLRGGIPVRKYRRAPGGVRQVEIARTAQIGRKTGFHFCRERSRVVAGLATDWQDFPHMNIDNDVVEAIGNTPLIKLKRASEATGCNILGKAEFMNPGQSVKDRAGRQMILEAEKRGDLKPGGLVLEGTAGNTGIGLAVVANARGYRTLIVIPDTQSQEKKDTLRLCRAQLIEVPAVPYANPNNYVKLSGRLAEQLRQRHPQGAIWAKPCGNDDNRMGHRT